MMLTSVLLAVIELLVPADGVTVTLIPDCQRAVMTNETRVAREAVLDALAPGGKPWRKHAEWRKARPLRLEWRVTEGEKGPWEVKVGTRPDLADARTWLIGAGEVDKATGRHAQSKAVGHVSYTVPYFNPEVAGTYYWQVSGNITCGRFGHRRICDCKDRKEPVSSGVFMFQTEDFAPRWIAIEGRTGNFRDLGGRLGYDGRRVRQGMIYRSQGLNDNSIDGVAKGKNRLTVSDVEYLTETLGVKTDLDLRSGGEVAGMNGVSPLGRDTKYVQRSSNAYDGIFSGRGKQIMAANFREFLNTNDYPIIFHCIGGADRTGALGYVLNGVLGVSRRELETDWESTFYPNIPYKDGKGEFVWNSEGHFDEGFAAYGGPDDGWNRRIELYLLDCGVTDEEIEKFRSIMLR